MMKHKFFSLLLFLTALGLPGFHASLRAAEAGGMLVEVQKSALSSKYDSRGDFNEVRRTMTLKISVKNNTMKPMEEGKLHYILLVQRWGSETESYERVEGDLKLEALPPWKVVVVQGGEVKLGGHMHGTSEHHLDHLTAWKVTITRGEQHWDFMSSSNFDTHNAKAKKVTTSSP